MKKVRGFTLIELMITVAIVAILASLAYPSYQSYQEKSRRADAHIALSESRDIVERFLLDQNISPSQLAATAPTLAATSPQGFYTIALQAPPTANLATYGITVSGSTAAYVIIATPTGVQAADSNCTMIVLDSYGNRGAQPVENVQECW